MTYIQEKVMSFKKDGYTVAKKAISLQMANLCFGYLITKKNVFNFLKKCKYVIPVEIEDYFGQEGDGMVNGTYSLYGSSLYDTLLIELKKLMQQKTKLNLFESYTYARLYKTGDILPKHIDRATCEISKTLNIGGDPWPIYLKNKNNKPVKILLEKGDMLIYRGCDLQHWRDPFKGKICGQVFLHYRTKKNYLNDTRPLLGLSSQERRLQIIS